MNKCVNESFICSLLLSLFLSFAILTVQLVPRDVTKRIITDRHKMFR